MALYPSSTVDVVSDEGVPFTVQQRFFWDRPGGDDCLYALIPFSLLLRGTVDPERVRRSIQRLIHRHDALRTRVILVPGQSPRQGFAAPTRYHLEVVDASTPNSSESEVEEKVRSELDTRFARRIALDRDSLFDATLFKLAAERYVLVFWIHHLLFDGHTPSLIVQEFWVLYAGSLRDDPQGPGEPTQYSQYCAWQQSVCRLSTHEHGAYWTRRLSGATPILWREVSSEPLGVRGVTEVAFSTVDAATTAELRAQATRSRKHLSLYALTAYALTVQDWCAQSDCVFAVNLSGRLTKEHLNVIGYLAQPLYLRVQASPGGGFDHLLKTLSKEYFSALFHMDFGQTVLESPALGAGTLFQWFPVEWQLTPPDSLNLEFRVEPFVFNYRGFFHEKFKLGVFVYETSDQLSLRGVFRPDCILRSNVERLLEEIRRRLEQQATSRP